MLVLVFMFVPFFFTCTRGIMLPFILASLLVLLRMPIVIFVNANIFIFIHVNVQSLLLVFMSFFFACYCYENAHVVVFYLY